MSAENRLTTDQLAALAPGDRVVVESAAQFGRSRRTAGTVVRISASDVVVKVSDGRRTAYTERFRLRDGVRIGGLGSAELVDTGGGPEPACGEAQRASRRIDALYREWARHRDDVDRLRQLHAAIGEALEDGVAGSSASPG